jgi:LemA protein
MLAVWIVLGLAAVIGLYVLLTYNRFVQLKVNVSEAWSDIEVQLKRRYNLIPNLVETVKGYASHEKGTLENVVKARNAAIKNEGTPAEQAKTENMLTGALRQLFALAEAYPNLKANENFVKLQGDLAQLEDEIQKSRRFYNGNVRVNNTLVQQFPSNLVAGAFHFGPAEFFEIDDAAERAVPKVAF